MTEHTDTIRDLHEALEIAEEHLDEIEAQHGSECHLYGDSWPGALHDIDCAFQAVVRIRRELRLPCRRETRFNHAAGRCYRVWVDPNAAPVPASADDDIPF